MEYTEKSSRVSKNCRFRAAVRITPPFRKIHQSGDSGTTRATRRLPGGSNRFRMLLGMAGLHNSVKSSLAGRTFSRFLRFGVLRGLRSIEIDPDDFRRPLANKHGLWVPNFERMKDVPTERLDAIAKALIRDAERLALAEGAGFGLGGMITFFPDSSLLTVITLPLIQRLSLLSRFRTRGPSHG